MYGITQIVPAFFRLIKIKVIAAVGFSAAIAYWIYPGGAWPQFLFLLSGVLLQAAAASALNQLQEKKFDALMPRTAGRPLPQGIISTHTAIVLITLMSLGGTALLLVIGTTPALLGIMNILFYNGLYTPLKSKSLLAILFGAAVGAIPPMMGWTAAGGHLFDPKLILIATFMYLWQIPHFGLLLLKYKDDYKRAGFHALNTLRPSTLRKVIWGSTLLMVMQGLLFMLFNHIQSAIIQVVILLSNVILLKVFYDLSRNQLSIIKLNRSFPVINIYMLVLLISLLVDQYLFTQ